MLEHFDSFDGADIIHLTMRYLLSLKGQPPRGFEAYFEFLEKEFNPKRLLDYEDLDRVAEDLLRTNHVKAKALLVDMYGYTRDSAIQVKPPWRMLYLASKLGCIAEIARLCFQKNGNRMPDLGQCRIDYKHPSERG